MRKNAGQEKQPNLSNPEELKELATMVESRLIRIAKQEADSNREFDKVLILKILLDGIRDDWGLPRLCAPEFF